MCPCSKYYWCRYYRIDCFPTVISELFFSCFVVKWLFLLCSHQHCPLMLLILALIWLLAAAFSGCFFQCMHLKMSQMSNILYAFPCWAKCCLKSDTTVHNSDICLYACWISHVPVIRRVGFCMSGKQCNKTTWHELCASSLLKCV